MTRLAVRRDLYLLVAIVAMIGLVSLRYGRFASPSNLLMIFNDTSPLVILTLGQMTVMLTRGIDLSMASNLCFCGMTVAMINAASPGTPLVVLLVVAALVGLVLGAINGLLVWKVAIPSIVVTLGTLAIYRGMAFVLSGGAWVNADQMSEMFKEFPRHDLLGLPVLSWAAILAVLLVAILLEWRPLGRAFYAVGGNPTASVYAGIDVGRTQFFAFCISGLLAGVTGYLWVARYVIASVEIANGYELNIVAACVIGGISIAGGVGSVTGAVLGALFLGIVNNALPVIDVSPFWQMAIAGAAIIFAIALNARSERQQGRIILKKAETA
jgi:rhamnose transport system permease protein